MVLCVFRGDLEAAGSMIENESFKVWPGTAVHKSVLAEEEIITDTAADITVPDSFGRINLTVQVDKTRMVAVQVPAWRGEQTASPPAFGA